MALWIVRAGKNGEQESDIEEKEVCAIGWNNLPELTNISSKTELNTIFLKYYKNDNEHSTRNKVNQIWAFLKTIKIGDMVAIPLKTEPGMVKIAKIDGGYNFDASSSNIKHFRKVKWLKDFHRSKFDQDIRNSLGAFLTVGQVRAQNAQQRVEDLINGINVNKVESNDEPVVETCPIDPESIAMDKIIEIIDRKFDGHDFAKLIDSILRAKGFNTKLSPKGADHGVDILVSKGTLGFGEISICVQVKSSKSPTDEDRITHLKGVCDRFKAKYGLFVSWGGMTRSTRDEINQSFFTIQMWDQKKILEEIYANYEKLDDEIKLKLPLKRIMISNDDDD